MEQANWWILLVAAFIPLVLRFVWYNPRVFGNAWMKAAEIPEERNESGNRTKTFALTYLFSLLAAWVLSALTVHQSGMIQLFLGEPALKDASSNISQLFNQFMMEHGQRHRTFGHGFIHGAEAGLFMGLSLIGMSALYEGRPARFTLIHVGYYMLCFALMGGVICTFL